MTVAAQPATKQDVEEIVIRVVNHAIEAKVPAIVGDIVGEIVGDALELISEQFTKVYKCLDQIDVRFDRLEAKIDDIHDVVEHHSIDIAALQRKTA